MIAAIRNRLLSMAQERRLKRRFRGFSLMSLGDRGEPWPGWLTAGLDPHAQFRHNVTRPFPGWMHGKFDFIWSERMLEHIDAHDVPAVLQHVADALSPHGRCRLCLPICFWGRAEINMLRFGNEAKCRQLGHVSWFTHEGFGQVTPACFGSLSPPDGFTRWTDVLPRCGLAYVPIRHYQSDGTLVLDPQVLDDAKATQFLDRRDIVIQRPDSLIFDLTRCVR